MLGSPQERAERAQQLARDGQHLRSLLSLASGVIATLNYSSAEVSEPPHTPLTSLRSTVFSLWKHDVGERQGCPCVFTKRQSALNCAQRCATRSQQTKCAVRGLLEVWVSLVHMIFLPPKPRTTRMQM